MWRRPPAPPRPAPAPPRPPRPDPVGADATPVGADADAVEGQEALVARQAGQIAALEAKFEMLAQKTKRQEGFADAYAGKKRGKYEGFPLRVTRCV